MYIRFPLSLRNVEDLLHERGIEISHETVRFWWNRFGPMFAADIRKKRVQQLRAHSNWRWHLDEVFVKINGETHYLWRAVDHEGEVLESYVTKRRDRKAALKFLRKSMKRFGKPEIIVTDKPPSVVSCAAGLRWHDPLPLASCGSRRRPEAGDRGALWVWESYVTKRRDRKAALKFLRKSMKRFGKPEIIVTDKLRSYGAAMKVIGNADRQETGRWLNNRVENSHQPFRRRERAMLRFRRMRSLQKFASVHSSIHNHFNQERALYSRSNFKLNRAAALAEWRDLCAA